MARHNRVRRFLSRVHSEEEAFSMIEAMVAVTILMIAIMMSIQPMMAAMIRITDARTLTVAENLAQAEIESCQQVGSGDQTAVGEQLAEIQLGVDIEGAVERILAVDDLELDDLALSRRPLRCRSHGHGHQLLDVGDCQILALDEKLLDRW